MEITDYGQIEIYDKIFDKLDIRGDALSCLESGKSYSALYKNMEIPVMVGSKYDKGRNPLRIKGYFVIDGICKTINNIKLEQEIGFSDTHAVLYNKDKVKIKSMFEFAIVEKSTNKEKIWSLPLNWEEITKYSNDEKRIIKYLLMIEKYGKKRNSRPIIRKEIDKITLCYMFDCWLKLREVPIKPWRLVTSGEIIEDCLNQSKNPMDCFRSNLWSFKKFRCVTTISENMKHYNIISDIEAVRRITIVRNRELAPKKCRMVYDEDKYKICPVQTSDGAICGTVNYLCVNARLVTENKTIEVVQGRGRHLFVNSEYRGEIDSQYINVLTSNYFMVFEYDLIVCAYYEKGLVIKGNLELSYAASLLPFRNHNPPIRTMFATSMLKQSIRKDDRQLLNIISGIRYLKEDVNPLNLAIMPWYGYNIEDAIVISKKVSKMYSTRKTTVYKEKAVNVINIYVKKNQYVEKGDALFKSFDYTKIKTVEMIYAENGGKVEVIDKDDNIKIVVAEYADLQVGDKMSSLHGQKGVISLIEDNMPTYRNEIGEIEEVDIIINPHAFPTRMTMGQIKEMNAKEVKIEGVKNFILVGKCEYMALRQQVNDKFQSRNGGKYDRITKQPVAGRKNAGGLRFGQMERDILIALNAWNTLKEIWTVDRVKAKFCPKTGIFNPPCCFEYKYINQSSLICISVVRALGYDILYKGNQYKIDYLSDGILPKTNTIKFGEDDPTDVRMMKDVVVLPDCLRTPRLKKLYKEMIKSDINTEVHSLLKNKNGLYHRNIEGHIVDRCIRSVITPNPKLACNEIQVPIEASMGANYGILNRQPTLNVGSMKLVKIKYSNDKTIKMNPLICKLFNADFDGDEMNIYIVDAKEVDEPKAEKCQDYILSEYLGLKNMESLTSHGVTANKEGIKLMIESGSKGELLNYIQIYEKINNVNGCFNDGLNEEQWYELCKEARIDICSIALNTPVTGHLQSLCNQRFI